MSKPLILEHDEKLKSEIISVGLGSDITISSSEDRVEKQLPFSTEQYKIGTELTLESDGRVRIGKGINSVLVVTQIYFYRPSKVDESKLIYVRRWHDNVNNYTGTFVSRQQYSVTQTVLECQRVIPVEEGDYISIGIQSSENDVISNNSMYTFLNITKMN